MKVAVLGGTGKMGRAIAKRLANGNKVIIGSRDPARAREAAKGIPGAVGMDYAGASREADAAVVSIPASAIGTVAPLAKDLAGKLVISMVNPLRSEGGFLHFAREKGSAAEELARLLPESRVATAFNNIPAGLLERDEVIPIDVIVAADSRETYEEVAKLVKSIPNLRPLYAGPLSQAVIVEMITALVLNLASLNGTGSLTTKFVSRKG
jgi:8-hydroxy-5-deazaflavin:NADPH oxidoreductase